MKMIRITAVILACLLCSCEKFSHSYFLSDSFGINLTPFIAKKCTSYSDGCLQIFDVSENDTLYKKFFSEKYLTEEISLGFGVTSFSPSQYGQIQYRKLGEFDGYTKIVFYIPKSKIIGFGYATAIGG